MTRVFQLHDDQGNNPANTIIPDRLNLQADTKTGGAPGRVNTTSVSPVAVIRCNKPHSLTDYNYTPAIKPDYFYTGFCKKFSNYSIHQLSRNDIAKNVAEGITPIQNNNISTTDSILFPGGQKLRGSDRAVTGGH